MEAARPAVTAGRGPFFIEPHCDLAVERGRPCPWKTTISRPLRLSDIGKTLPGAPGALVSSLVKEGTNKSGTPKQAHGRCATYLCPRSWVANGSTALMAGAPGWPCDGPSPTQGKPGGVPVVPYPPRLLRIDAVSRCAGGPGTRLRLFRFLAVEGVAPGDPHDQTGRIRRERGGIA